MAVLEVKICIIIIFWELSHHPESSARQYSARSSSNAVLCCKQGCLMLFAVLLPLY